MTRLVAIKPVTIYKRHILRNGQSIGNWLTAGLTFGSRRSENLSINRTVSTSSLYRQVNQFQTKSQCTKTIADYKV